MARGIPREALMKKSSLKNKSFAKPRVGALSLTLFFCSLAGASPANVRLEGTKVIALPDSDHKPVAQSVYVAETEDCSAKVVSSREIVVSENCGYVRGLYRYVFDAGEAGRKQALVGFGVHHGGKGARTLLVNPTIELEETAFQPD